MAGFTTSEILFYSGIGIMLLSILIGGIGSIIFLRSGKKIKEQLEEEYGKPRHS